MDLSREAGLYDENEFSKRAIHSLSDLIVWIAALKEMKGLFCDTQ